MTFAVQFPAEPVLVPVKGSARLFELIGDFVVVLDGSILTIPRGFQTDFATIPPELEPIIDNDDPRILKPAILHDLLCDKHGDIFDDHRVIYDSTTSAAILRDAMIPCGASLPLRELIFISVALRGPHWKISPSTP